VIELEHRLVKNRRTNRWTVL